MRIRRRPQSSPSSSPSFLLQQLQSDPSTSAAPQQTPRNAGWRSLERRGLLDGGGGGSEERPPHLLHAASNADLGSRPAVARRLALPPQDNAVGCVDSPGGAGRGADDLHGHRRGLVNGHGGADWKVDVACTGRPGEQAVKMEGPVANGAATPVVTMLPVKDEKTNGSDGSGGTGTGGGPKKRRGPAVLLEGSRCSRVNGRGWRCSQPTLVGYSLCEHHLGKGRMRAATAAAAGAGRGGPGQLGRTEHRARIPVAAAIGAVTTAAAKAEEPGGLGRY